jgi:hypothetical protein
MHTNALAILYFIIGYFTAFCLLFTTNEIYLKSLGCLMLVYLTYSISEQL